MARPTRDTVSTPLFSRVLETMVLSVCSLDVAIVANGLPNIPNPTPAQSPLLTLNGHANCYRLLYTPCFESARDNGTVGLLPRRHAQWSQPHPDKNPCPRLTARPTGAVFPTPPFSRVMETIAPSVHSLDTTIVISAMSNLPDPTSKTITSSLLDACPAGAIVSTFPCSGVPEVFTASVSPCNATL